MNEILIKSIVEKYLRDNVPSGKLIDDIDYEDGEINILYTNGDADYFEIDIPTPKDGKDGKDGQDGKDYILTKEDKKKIAREIQVPIVEKVIEKTEVIKEVPIITNEIKEVAKYETSKEIVKKIESLEGQERLSAKAIKGLEEFMVEGPRAGATKLTSLTDTNIVNPIEGQTLVYNQGRSQRENKVGLGGTTIHNELTGRDANDAHPISAITGLQTELDSKLDITSLSSNITLYATTTASVISGYNKLVTSISDPDYDEPAIDVSTGAITGVGQIVGQLVSEPGLFVGNPGIINITTIGQIRKTSGGASNAEFYFKVFHRTSAGVETEIAVSNYTGAITTTVYAQFNTGAILNNGDFVATDRIVIKYYADKIGGGSNPVYDFQFGGDTPIRTLLPIPATLILTDYYTKTETDGLLDDKQDTLVSGTNIKTINGNSVLGPGDLIVGGSSTGGGLPILPNPVDSTFRFCPFFLFGGTRLSSAATNTFTINRMHFRPFILNDTIDINEIGITMHTAGTGSYVIGIYDDVNGRPNSLIVGTPQQTNNTVGIQYKPYTISPTVQLEKGKIYWYSFLTNNIAGYTIMFAGGQLTYFLQSTLNYGVQRGYYADIGSGWTVLPTTAPTTLTTLGQPAVALFLKSR